MITILMIIILAMIKNYSDNHRERKLSRYSLWNINWLIEKLETTF